jgi:hypothetical protein
MKSIRLFFIVLILFSLGGCSRQDDRQRKKDGVRSVSPDRPVSETVVLPSGRKVRRTLAGSERERIEEIMGQTISGKIKLIYVHPRPESLPLALREGAAFVTIVPDEGEMFFPAGELTEKLRPHAGERVTIVGIEKRTRAKYMGDTYPLVRLLEIKKIGE